MAKEVGTEGTLGGQAEVAGVSGTWRGLTEYVNSMATNLTDQVRNISQVAQAVARGDLTQKITVDAKGEILELKDTLNTMVDQLSSFADEVTRVAKEVGTEGKLGGQAQVEGVSGTWRGLTENVNQLAVEPHDPGASDRGRVHRRDPGRPDPIDHRRGQRRGRGPLGQHQPDDRQPARDHSPERGAGLAQDEPGPHLRPDAGPARPRDGHAADHVRARAGGRARSTARSSSRTTRRRAPTTSCRLLASYGYTRRKQVANRVPPGRRARRPGGAREEADPDHRSARGLRADRVRARRGRRPRTSS